MSRLAFANQLRGLAAASVACSHLIGVFWVMRDVAAAVTFSPPQTGPNPPLLMLVLHPWFNFGPFGVALFFLISGLVIPISLGQHTRGSFLLARLLRIYPTYAVAFMLEMAAVYASSLYWHRPFGYGAWTILSNALLIQDVVGQPSVDLVNWTLCVELRFYLLMAAFAAAIRQARIAPLLGIAVAACAVNAAITAGAPGGPSADPLRLSYAASTESLFIVFMLIGVLFNYHLRGRIGTTRLLTAATGLLALFALSWRLSVLADQFPGVTANYACALVLFACLYAVRRFVPKNPLLDALAAISFPLYCIHSLIGYTLLKVMIVSWDLGYPAALAATVALLTLVATALHRTVETASIRLGRKLASHPSVTGNMLHPGFRRGQGEADAESSATGRVTPRPVSRIAFLAYLRAAPRRGERSARRPGPSPTP